MRTLTKIYDPLDRVFTLQNRVRKNVVPPWGKQAPIGPPMGSPISEDGGLCPHGGPISIDGGTVMPIGETNGQRNVLLYKAELVTNAMGFPHGL